MRTIIVGVIFLYHLYVIRHGETEWNTEKRLQGRLDSNLTAKGETDAQLLGERLKEIDFQRIISSPSNRTIKTARLVRGERKVSIETDERLMEIDLGEWQGLKEDEIKSRYPEKAEAFWHIPSSYESVDGESFFDVKKRVAAFLEDLDKTKPTGNVLVVTHGIVIKALYLLCRNESVENLWKPPFIHGTSLTIIHVENGELKLHTEACTAHCS